MVSDKDSAKDEMTQDTEFEKAYPEYAEAIRLYPRALTTVDAFTAQEAFRAGRMVQMEMDAEIAGKSEWIAAAIRSQKL